MDIYTKVLSPFLPPPPPLFNNTHSKVDTTTQLTIALIHSILTFAAIPLSFTPVRPLLLTHPFSAQPSAQELSARLGLIQRHHVAACMQSHEREVAAALDVPDLRPLDQLLAVVGREGEVLQGGFVVEGLAWPLERFSPGAVAQVVADEVGVPLRWVSRGQEEGEGRGGEHQTYSVDKHRDFLQDLRHQTMKRLHPIAREQKAAVDIEIAAIVTVRLRT